MQLTRYFMLQWRRRTNGTIAMSGDEILVQTQDCGAPNFETPSWLELALGDNALLEVGYMAPVPATEAPAVVPEVVPEKPKGPVGYKLGDLRARNAEDPDAALRELRVKLDAGLIKPYEKKRMATYIRTAHWVHGTKMVRMLEGK